MSKKLILVTAKWDSVRKYVEAVCKGVSEQLGIPLEVREEDFSFLVDHGEKDDFGGVEVPQVFVESDGNIRHVFSRIPLTETGQPDIRGATEMLKKALQEA